MDIRKLQRAIVDGLEDVKAQAIVVYNTEAMSALFERVIIATGASNRQTKALAASVRDAVRSRGMQVMRTEGEENGEWIIVDCGAAVAHIMQPAIREYYHLEEIWGGKPVKMKLGDNQGTKLVKASEEPAACRRSCSLGALQGAGEESSCQEARHCAPPGHTARGGCPRQRAQGGGGQAGRAQGCVAQGGGSARHRRTQTACMKLLVLAIGQRQPAWADAAWADFAKRFPPEMRLELKALKAEAAQRSHTRPVHGCRGAAHRGGVAQGRAPRRARRARHAQHHAATGRTAGRLAR